MLNDILSYEEEMILFLYEGLYDKEYSPFDNDVNDKKILIRHINVQKANYIFYLLGMYVGDYYFGWGEAGPYSISLQKTIKELDNKVGLIKDYYVDLKKNKKTVAKKIFRENQISYIESVIKSLNSITTIKNGSEVLASLAFINKNYCPNCGKNVVIEKLIELKPYLKGFNNKQAWSKLEELNII